MSNTRNISFLVLVLLLGLYANAQNSKRIEILNANSIEFDEKIGKDVKRLLGNVQFKHGNALMFCDSAYLNSKTNILQAYSNVHIIQNDSIDLYGDYLNYNGNTKMAKVRQNVRLIHDNSTLTTDSLDFDRVTNIAHYYSWGYLKDGENDLESIQGYYYSNDKDYYAVDSVKLVNPDYTIYSDSLRYNTGTDISYFYGPTDIVSDSNFIYCEYGWYETKGDLAKVSKNSYIQNKEKKLNGDSIFYDRNKSFGEAFGNVSILDTSAQILITGHYANYYEKPDRAFVTDSALLTKYGGGDTLFLHADTLRMYTVYDTLWTEELQFVDSVFGDTLEYSIPTPEDLLEDEPVAMDSVYVQPDSLTIDSINNKLTSDTLAIEIVNDSLLLDMLYDAQIDSSLQSLISESDSLVPDSLSNIDYEIEINKQDTVTPTDIINPSIEFSLSDQVSIDTILSYTIDTLKIVTAYQHTQIFKNNLQTRCDSLSYSTKDSTIRLYGNPIIWSEDQQISASYIEILTANNNPTEIFIDQNAFIALKDDSIRFNQIEGLSMRGYFSEDNELERLLVMAQAKSIFFPREEATEQQKQDSVQGELVGANVTESARMMIWFEDNQPHKITMYSNPNGVLNPVEYKPIDELRLNGFSWKDAIRPKRLSDIFIWKEDGVSVKEEEK